MCTKKVVTASQAMLGNATAGISGLIEDAVGELVTIKSRNRMKREHNRLQAMFQGFVTNTLDEKLNIVELGDHSLRKTEKEEPSRRQAKKMMEAMLDNQDFIATGVTIVKTDTKKTVDVCLK